MEKDLISILMPVYNSEKYLRKCLEALKNQTYQNIEIICVNDGSTDSSYDILLEYQNIDNRFKVFTQENSGPATSRNHCLSKAQGKYIMFCDSDDKYEPNMCQKMIETMKKENVNLVMCCANLECEEKIARLGYDGTWGHSITPIGKINLDKLLMEMPSPFLWQKIFKKELIDKHNLRFPDGLEHDDALFCYEYFCICKTAFGIKDKLYNYLLRKNSVMDNYHKFANDKSENIQILKYFYKFLVENKIEDKFEKAYLNLFTIGLRRLLRSTKQNETEKREKYYNVAKDIIEDTKYKRVKNNILYLLEKYPSEKFRTIVMKKSKKTLINGSFSIPEKIAHFFYCLKIYIKYSL